MTKVSLIVYRIYSETIGPSLATWLAKVNCFIPPLTWASCSPHRTSLSSLSSTNTTGLDLGLGMALLHLLDLTCPQPLLFVYLTPESKRHSPRWLLDFFLYISQSGSKMIHVQVQFLVSKLRICYCKIYSCSLLSFESVRCWPCTIMEERRMLKESLHLNQPIVDL